MRVCLLCYDLIPASQLFTRAQTIVAVVGSAATLLECTNASARTLWRLYIDLCIRVRVPLSLTCPFNRPIPSPLLSHPTHTHAHVSMQMGTLFSIQPAELQAETERIAHLHKDHLSGLVAGSNVSQALLNYGRTLWTYHTYPCTNRC